VLVKSVARTASFAEECALLSTALLRRGPRPDDLLALEVADTSDECQNKYKLFMELSAVLVVAKMVPESGGTEDQKVSSPKWSDYSRRWRCSRSSEPWLSPYRVSPPRYNRVRSSRWPRVTGLKSGPQPRIAPHRSGPISPPLVCNTGARAEKSWKLVL
jgi:hypothetical protein